MNLTRIMLSASVVLAISALVGLPINAESPGLVPTRLASGKLTSAEPPFDHLFQSDFSHVQLVADEFDFADQNDSLQSEDSENREHRSDTRSTTAEPLPEPRDRDSDQTDAVEEDFDDEESAPEQADDEDDRRRNDRIMAGIVRAQKASFANCDPAPPPTEQSLRIVPNAFHNTSRWSPLADWASHRLIRIDTRSTFFISHFTTSSAIWNVAVWDVVACRTAYRPRGFCGTPRYCLIRLVGSIVIA